MSIRIVAIGQDAFWLSAVQRALAGWPNVPFVVKCPGDISNCIGSLPSPEANTVLLVDASGQRDMEKIVGKLRAQGWKYVVVVAADPSAKEATAILRRNLGYDYWEKTYDDEEIRRRVDECVGEITTELPPIKRNSDQSWE